MTTTLLLDYRATAFFVNLVKIEVWEARVREATPVLKDRSRALLRNSLPKFLHRLVEVLGQSEVKNEPIPIRTPSIKD